MEKEVVYSTEAPKPIGPYSQAVWAGDTLFVSGQIALDPASGELIQGNIETETKVVLNNVKAILDKAGIGFSNIVKTSIFLKNMDDFAAVNVVYASYFTSDFPARETVQVSKLPKDVNVEISVIAIR
ncbi:MAG: RidA family protein [Chitinophagales bacterium]|jgi:2-iminobutanoate/2-iminopropanoate deaminase|nr:RidA family protein [Chitinophagales bacterium]